MNKLDIARVCHEINRAYALGSNDPISQHALPWDEAPEDQRKSCVLGVEAHLANPDMTPEESHRVWAEHKAKDGWTYGPFKDETLKQHPCMVPYDELPVQQRTKDYLFRAVVHNLSKFLDATRHTDGVVIPSNGPKVTDDKIEAAIESVNYLYHETLTVAVVKLKNGYSVTGESACVDPRNYVRETGEHFALKDAKRKMWPLLGFALAERLANGAAA